MTGLVRMLMVRARDLEIDKDSGVSSPSLGCCHCYISLAYLGHALTSLNCFHKLRNFMQVPHTVKLSSKPMSSISSIIQSAWFWEDPLEKEMATHSSVLAWRIPWTEEPRGLQSTGSQRVGHNWATNPTHTHTSCSGHTIILGGCEVSCIFTESPVVFYKFFVYLLYSIGRW